MLKILEDLIVAAYNNAKDQLKNKTKEEIEAHKVKLEEQFRLDKKNLEEEMEKEVEVVRNRKD